MPRRGRIHNIASNRRTIVQQPPPQFCYENDRIVVVVVRDSGGTAAMHVGGCTSSGVGGGGPDTLVQKKEALCCSAVALEACRCTCRRVMLAQGVMLEQLKRPTRPLTSLPVPAMLSNRMSRIATASSPGGQGYGF